jgi:hypothetical protein
MSSFGEAWLLDKMGNCIEVYAHQSEYFEFESIVDLISRYGDESDKNNCEEWKSTKSETAKAAILYSYYQNWCRVRLWKDDKLTFRIGSTDFNWYKTIVEFLLTHSYVGYASITVSDLSGRIYWDDVSYNYSINLANEKILSSVFL